MSKDILPKFAFDISGPSIFSTEDGRKKRGHITSQQATASRQRTIARTGRDPADFTGISSKSDSEIARRMVERKAGA